jgi:hypothetical protein
MSTPDNDNLINDIMDDPIVKELKALLDNPSSPLASLFPGKTSKDLSDLSFLLTVGFASESLSKDTVIESGKNIIATFNECLASHMRILNERDKVMSALRHTVATQNEMIAEKDELLKVQNELIMGLQGKTHNLRDE